MSSVNHNDAPKGDSTNASQSANRRLLVGRSTPLAPVESSAVADGQFLSRKMTHGGTGAIQEPAGDISGTASLPSTSATGAERQNVVGLIGPTFPLSRVGLASTRDDYYPLAVNNPRADAIRKMAREAYEESASFVGVKPKRRNIGSPGGSDGISKGRKDMGETAAMATQPPSTDGHSGPSAGIDNVAASHAESLGMKSQRRTKVGGIKAADERRMPRKQH